MQPIHPYGTDALHHARWIIEAQMLVGNDHEPPGHRVEQFAGAQQVIGIGRASEALVSESEGLVDQHAIARDGRDDIGKNRPPEIVRDDDASKGLAGVGKCPPVLEVNVVDLAHRPERGLNAGGITVNAGHAVSGRYAQRQVPPSSAGDIEDPAARRHGREETGHPRRWRSQRRKAGAGRRVRFQDITFDIRQYYTGETFVLAGLAAI